MGQEAKSRLLTSPAQKRANCYDIAPLKCRWKDMAILPLHGVYGIAEHKSLRVASAATFGRLRFRAFVVCSFFAHPASGLLTRAGLAGLSNLPMPLLDRNRNTRPSASKHLHQAVNAKQMNLSSQQSTHPRLGHAQ
jgi:hypothetical protein